MSATRSFARVRTCLVLASALIFIGAGQATASISRLAASSTTGAAIILPVNGDITVTVDSKNAGDQLAFGLSSPEHRVMCGGSCMAGMTRDFGRFEVGTTLVFYLRDRTHGQTYLSTNPSHAEVESVSPVKWTIHWDDAGGDGDFNDLVTSIVLTGAP